MGESNVQKTIRETEAAIATMFRSTLFVLIRKKAWDLDEDVEKLLNQEQNYTVIAGWINAALDAEGCESFMNLVRKRV